MQRRWQISRLKAAAGDARMHYSQLRNPRFVIAPYFLRDSEKEATTPSMKVPRENTVALSFLLFLSKRRKARACIRDLHKPWNQSRIDRSQDRPWSLTAIESPTALFPITLDTRALARSYFIRRVVSNASARSIVPLIMRATRSLSYTTPACSRNRCTR